MATNRIRWEGLDELKALLRTLPAELTAEGGAIVEAHARAADNAIAQSYPIGKTGNLAGGMRVTINANGRYGTGALIKNAAPHAWFYEHGTVKREYETQRNKKRKSVGRMPPHPVFIPIMQDFRDLMYEELAHMLVRYGFAVSVRRVA